MSEIAAVILAAGKGTRMKSKLPKILHPICHRPMIERVLDAVSKTGISRAVVVVGFGGDKIKSHLEGKSFGSMKIEFVDQTEQLGTGHAVMQTEKFFNGFTGKILVTCGDTPLLKSETLKKFVEDSTNSSASVMTTDLDDATGYGRVIRDQDGSFAKIVEHKDANESERAIREINAGVYCFDSRKLFDALKKITNQNAQGEYYLPDTLAILKSEGESISCIKISDSNETLGINSRKQLADAEKIMYQWKNLELMDSGVTISDPDSTFIDPEVEIGIDTTILPGTIIEGNSKIGEDCVIGAYIYIQDSIVENGVKMGPFVHLRPGTRIESEVKIGNFVEVKNSTIGKESKLPHLQYIGDTDMGSRVNVGCGTVTCNYDGKKKYRTKIGDDVFIGCNSNLVAPVEIENGAYLAAGGTITKNVPADNLAIARARQVNFENWNDRRK